MNLVQRSAMVLAIAVFFSCKGDTGPMGPAGPEGPAGAQGLPGPAGASGGTRITLSGIAGANGRVTIALPAAAGSNVNVPPSMSCYVMNPAALPNTWWAVIDGFSQTGEFCYLLFNNGWTAEMNNMAPGDRAAFVIMY